MTMYYWLRDRIPFILTLLYFVKPRIKKIHMDLIGQYLWSATGLFTLVSIYLMLDGQLLIRLVGMRWSFPSPIEWGILIIAGSWILQKKIPIFDAYYLSFMAGIGGGWIYEILYGIPYWIKSGFAQWNVFNARLVKVFFIDFQVFCIPILFFILRERFNYRFSNKLKYLSVLVISFYLFGFQIAPFFHRMGNFGGNGFYGWVLRIPVVVFLYLVLSEVSESE